MYSMQQAMINGESLEYTVQGSHGEPVILIHGRMFADMYSTSHVTIDSRK